MIRLLRVQIRIQGAHKRTAEGLPVIQERHVGQVGGSGAGDDGVDFQPYENRRDTFNDGVIGFRGV